MSRQERLRLNRLALSVSYSEASGGSFQPVFGRKRGNGSLQQFRCGPYNGPFKLIPSLPTKHQVALHEGTLGTRKPRQGLPWLARYLGGVGRPVLELTGNVVSALGLACPGFPARVLAEFWL